MTAALPPPQLRPPEQVSRLARLGCFHQSRLSFMRVLLRRMKAEDWAFSRPKFDIGAKGVGTAVYSAHTPHRTYSLVAFAHDLPDHLRSDRVIATAWDATFTLFDGVPEAEDIKRLAQNVPLQEAGRISQKELSLSRANRSVRLWDHVVTALSEGRQPDAQTINSVGYLMRTTAVYGSGKFGACDWHQVSDRPEFSSPFQAELLSVYLTRVFIRDLVEHMAKEKGGERAVPLDPDLARGLGIGNSTGLGMAPFIVNHPVLFNNWIAARETALWRVRSLESASKKEASAFHEIFARAEALVKQWRTDHPVQSEKLEALHQDLEALKAHLEGADLGSNHPWHRMIYWSQAALSLEGQELLVSLVLEPYGALIDDLAATMADHGLPKEPLTSGLSLAALKQLVETTYSWALEIDWQDKREKARLWYTSAEKLEPRLGERFEEDLDPYEQPLAPGHDAYLLYQALKLTGADESLADFLAVHPEFRHIVARLAACQSAPYGEIRDNTISAALLPIDMLRCKLSFFGATHFDPRSDRWVRITMYQNAPFPEELKSHYHDLWPYPPAKEAS